MLTLNMLSQAATDQPVDPVDDSAAQVAITEEGTAQVQEAVLDATTQEVAQTADTAESIEKTLSEGTEEPSSVTTELANVVTESLMLRLKVRSTSVGKEAFATTSARGRRRHVLGNLNLLSRTARRNQEFLKQHMASEGFVDEAKDRLNKMLGNVEGVKQGIDRECAKLKEKGSRSEAVKASPWIKNLALTRGSAPKDADGVIASLKEARRRLTEGSIASGLAEASALYVEMLDLYTKDKDLPEGALKVKMKAWYEGKKERFQKVQKTMIQVGDILKEVETAKTKNFNDSEGTIAACPVDKAEKIADLAKELAEGGALKKIISEAASRDWSAFKKMVANDIFSVDGARPMRGTTNGKMLSLHSIARAELSALQEVAMAAKTYLSKSAN